MIDWDMMDQPVRNPYRPEELVNEETVGLIRWYLEHKLGKEFIRRCSDQSIEDIVQDICVKLLTGNGGDRQFAHTTVITKQAYWVVCGHAKKQTRRIRTQSYVKTPVEFPVVVLEEPDLDEIDVQPYLKILTQRDRLIMRLRYGIGIEKGWTLEEIADVIGVTRERVRQIQKNSLKKIRNRFKC